MLGKPSKRTRKKLEEHGKRAPALVVEIAEKGMSVTSGAGNLVSQTEVMLKTKLRVEPEDEPAFEVEERFRYPQLSIPAVGSRLAVIYDPSDHDKVMIDRDAAAAAELGAMPGMEGMDLEDVMTKVRDAESQTQDPQELGRMLAQEFGANVNVSQQDSSGVSFGGPPAGFGAPPPAEDPVDKLAKLAELREKGMLTDAEFQSQKARILGES